MDGEFPSRIDRYDRAILREMVEDGRIPVTTLAERIGLSANATGERLRRLMRSGAIEGVHARVAPHVDGRPLIAFVEVKLERTAGDVFAAFAAAAARTEAIEECHMVAGGFDYLIKTRHADMAAYRRFLADSLLELPGVRETHTFIVMEAVKRGR